MALNIKSLEADHLARELAHKTGRSITDAVIQSLRDSLAKETARNRRTSLAEELTSIGKCCAALLDLDQRTPEEIIGFDEIGVPR